MKEQIIFPDIIESALVRNFERLPVRQMPAMLYAWDVLTYTAEQELKYWKDIDMVISAIECRTDDIIDAWKVQELLH